MSSCGWLLTVGEDFATQLINPLSREIINLPKADTFQETIYPLEWNDIISKVVLLMESKLVLVIYEGKLGFCHIGDSKWTSVQQPFDNDILEVTFYNEQVYTFDWNKIQACNVNRKDPGVLVDVATMPEDEYDLHHRGARSYYIAGLDDGERKQLLVIIRFFEGRMTTKSFKVLAYDLESGKWSKVKDFGKKTLFVGWRGSSFWIEDNTGVIKGNCIYYTDSEFFNNPDGGIGGVRYMGNYYHMSDGTIETHFTGESRPYRYKTHFYAWLQSM